MKAAEEQRAQQEAELFKNKTQTSTFQTEEVSPCGQLELSIAGAAIAVLSWVVHTTPHTVKECTPEQLALTPLPDVLRGITSTCLFIVVLC